MFVSLLNFSGHLILESKQVEILTARDAQSPCNIGHDNPSSRYANLNILARSTGPGRRWSRMPPDYA